MTDHFQNALTFDCRVIEQHPICIQCRQSHPISLSLREKCELNVLYFISETALAQSELKGDPEMTDHTKMTEPEPRPTAKIYQFPARPRVTQSAAPTAPKLTSFPWESGWYHEEAIDEEHIKPAAGPAV